MQPLRLAIVALAIAPLGGTSQDLPPGVLLLARIKSHMAEKFERLPDYTCLETVQRFHRNAGPNRALKALDTLRLEILYSKHQDLYASPGDRQFRTADASSFIGSGMIGSGFATQQLSNVLQGTANLAYEGEEDRDGRKTVRYDFHMSHHASGYTIDVIGGKGTVGVRGTIWADPESLEVVRMEDHAIEIPSFLPVEDASSVVVYTPVKIGDREEVLPQSAELHLRQLSGEASSDYFEFTHCGSFRTESSIHFDTDVVRPAAGSESGIRTAGAPKDPDQDVPALMLVPVMLTTPVSDKDTVGSLIEGKVTADVRRKGKVAIPRGSPVRGRIRRLERSVDTDGYFVVGLEFTEVQVEGRSMRFYADLLKIDHAPGIDVAVTKHSLENAGDVSRTDQLTLPDLPGVALFFVKGKTFRLPPELQMMWRTRGYLR